MTKKTVVIDNELNDDWMKSLPGYKDEIRLHEKLANEKKGKKSLLVEVKRVMND